MAKNLFIKTYGCQMNVYDSDRMADVLAPLGYTTVDGIDNADMVLINTCHIREKASEKVFSALGRLRAWKTAQKDRGIDAKIAVAGCVAQAEGAELHRRAPWVDIVVGPGSYHRLPELIARIDPGSRTAVVDTDFPIEDKFDFLPEESAPRGASAFLSIQEGCDKFCTFCVVPYTRGAEFSRPAAKIIFEAKRLIAQGTVELTLLGQNVNAWYGEAPDGGRWNFAQLLHGLAEIKGLARLRYTTSHPADMNDDLITAHRVLPQLMPYLHLPVQSGSDRILTAMNRRHTADDYRRIIDKLRASRPDIALSGDFIVGFPGESAKDFADTISLIAEIGYASGYSFKYSARPGTPAAALQGQVDEAVKAERLQSLQQLLAAQQLAFNREKLGCVMDILVEKPAKHAQKNRRQKRGQSSGRSPWMQAVHFPGTAAPIGTIIPVKITAAHQHSLRGASIP